MDQTPATPQENVAPVPDHVRRRLASAAIAATQVSPCAWSLALVLAFFARFGRKFRNFRDLTQKTSPVLGSFGQNRLKSAAFLQNRREVIFFC
jgi:hypothetical protein